jgi:DNA-directed RNA polymerase subunit H (RpoH/RPB5)
MSKEKNAVITMTRTPKETIPKINASKPVMNAPDVFVGAFVVSAATIG